MLSEKNPTHLLDLSKSEELSYQLSEQKYHLKSAEECFNEAIFHLKKASHHASMAKDCNKIFKQ